MYIVNKSNIFIKNTKKFAFKFILLINEKFI